VATLGRQEPHGAELVIVPALDILQSVPGAGFLTFTVVFFLGLFPGSEFGAECAAIFAIFTSQAWNMAFSFYQSLRTVPRDLGRGQPALQLSPWLRFWRQAPFAGQADLEHRWSCRAGRVPSSSLRSDHRRRQTVKLPGIGSWARGRHRR